MSGLEDVQRRQNIIAAASEILSGSFFVQIGAHTLRFVARRERIDDQGRDAFREQVVDRDLLLSTVRRIIEPPAPAHVNDRGKRPCARRLEQRAGNIFGRRVIDWNRDGVGVFAPNRRPCLIGCDS